MGQILINLDAVSISLGGRPIFDGLKWEIQAGQRIGLVGPNGAGKSTLLKLIATELTADSGHIFRQSGLTWGRLPQEPAVSSDTTVWTEALTAVPELNQIEAEMARLEAKMGEPAVYGDGDALARVMGQHEKLVVQYEQYDGSSYQSRLKETLTRLGLDEAHWATPTAHLSGGQKKLIMLAKLIVRQPDLLLLDEPDNHLDLPAKRRLEGTIQRYPGCVVIISHDRYLLDEVATHIAELENGRLTLYQGNYSAYSNERELRRLRQQQLYAAQQKEIARIEAAIKRFELWASLVVNERHIRQARSRRKMLDEMDKVEKVTETRRMTLEMNGHRGSKKAVQLMGVSKQLPNGRWLFRDLDLTVWHGDRIGLVGPNGAGKSMLLKQILKPEGSDGGEIRVGPSNQVGYYAQEHETLDYAQDLISAIRQTAPVTRETAVAILHRFLFSYDQMQGPIGKLSGGERSRLQLARLMLERPNLLLLDEPTNNLDIPAIEVLEETLEDFIGAVVIISHDRYFLDQTVDRIIELRDGRLSEFWGGYTDYLANN